MQLQNHEKYILILKNQRKSPSSGQIDGKEPAKDSIYVAFHVKNGLSNIAT